MTNGSAGKGWLIDLATPLQVSCSMFCSTIQAPIITSMVVSMLAPRSFRRRVNSITPPKMTPIAIAAKIPTKKLTPIKETNQKSM